MGTGDKHSNSAEEVQAPSINELTRLAHKRLQKGDLQGAMEHYERAVEGAKLTNDPTVKISSCLNAGACLVSLGHYRRGLGLLESACKLLKKAGITAFDRDTELDRIQAKSSPTSSKPGDRQLLEMGADVYFNTAVAAQGLHDFKKSTSCFKISIDLYLKAGAKNHAADGFSSLAGCYQEAGQLEQEMASLVSAQQLYNELEDSSNEAMMCVELAKVYLRVGKKEDCKRMIATAKLQALRVDNPRIQGKLHSQFGLLHTSLGMFDEAIQNFEKALPLVRSGVRSANSLQVEASLLQNIGAAYNELGRYFDAVIYHREAATLHGKTKNLISESKCLCNLAFAQAQLKDYPEAAKNFSNALAKAHKARNNYIQFQACEGLGAINYHMGKYGEAVTYFKQALGILDEIKQETGIPRERVMEKLSDAEEALQIMKAKQRQRDFSRSHQHLKESSGLAVTGTPGSTSDNSSIHANGSPHSLRRRLSPELIRGSDGEEAAATAAAVNGHSGSEERPPLPERRGVGFLPPIGPQKPSRKHAVPRKRNSGRQQQHHHLPPLKTGNDTVTHHQHQQQRSVKLKRHDSLDADVQEYINSYRDSPLEEGTFQQSSQSGSENSHGSARSDVDGDARDSGDQLGASMFSRHAPRPNSSRFNGSAIATPDSLRESGGLTMPSHASSPCPAYEGCLALGQNTRQLYTTQTRIVKEGRKKRRKTEIVPITPTSTTSGATGPGQSPSSPAVAIVAVTSPTTSSTGSQSQPQAQTKGGRTTSNQSKICVIL